MICIVVRRFVSISQSILSVCSSSVHSVPSCQDIFDIFHRWVGNRRAVKLIMKAHVQNVDLLRKEIDSWPQTLLRAQSGSHSELRFQMLPGGLQEQLKSIAKHCQVADLKLFQLLHVFITYIPCYSSLVMSSSACTISV